MAQTLARVTCPNCNQPFTAPLEQVLDVELDPSAKARLLSGQVNIVVCPHCGMGGSVNMPFIYHDASKDLALVFLPMEAGRHDLERQQLIGSLSRAVMNQMPPEQRKSYLLNPQVFFTYDSLTKRVLEADGITPEMIETQKAKADLLRRLLEAPTSEARSTLIGENEPLLDDEFFHILYANLAQAEAMGRQDLVQRMLEVRTLLFEQTVLGRRLAARAEALQALQTQPTREKLVDLLLGSDDPETRSALITFGQPLVDYLFFQTITQRIEATEDETERKRLEDLRQEVLSIREEMKEQARQVVDARLALVQDLVTTEKPELLARRRLPELDELFFSVLAAEIEQARQDEEFEAAARLHEIWQLTMGLIQEQIPPEMILLTRLLEAEDIEEIRQLLEANHQLVTEPFVEILKQVEQELKERGESGPAKRATAALAMAQTMVKPQEGLVAP
ncbi:MAG TPA: hypothetical protein EYH30_04860 [Anaerolineales bacterium]|nr:hypothetical protein [Anaerolineae bacterium]HIQ01445.1 hypothetical protein [Anaerolineales bacterium]